MEGEKEVKLIIFLDDDNKSKEREVVILEENEYGVRVKLYDSKINKIVDAPAFFIPWHRVLKIKDKNVL